MPSAAMACPGPPLSSFTTRYDRRPLRVVVQQVPDPLVDRFRQEHIGLGGLRVGDVNRLAALQLPPLFVGEIDHGTLLSCHRTHALSRRQPARDTLVGARYGNRTHRKFTSQRAVANGRSLVQYRTSDFFEARAAE
jgi:hypothetical protein